MKNRSEDTSDLWNPLNLTLNTLKLLQLNAKDGIALKHFRT